MSIFFRFIHKAVILSCLTSATGFALSLPDLVPMPKRYEPQAGRFVVSGVPLYIDSDNRQCELGAHDVAARVAELGGEAGAITPSANLSAPGIYLLTVDSPAGTALVKELVLDITADNPGPQGYIIHPAGNRLIIIGSDSVGALYGAMTLRQMLQADVSESVSIASAKVYDRPDYSYRSSMSCGRSLRNWTLGETNALAGYKAGIDWMMRFKINILSDYHSLIGSRDDASSISPETRASVKEINRYAVERGIYPMLLRFSFIGVDPFAAEDPAFKNWDCLAKNEHGKNFYYCWSRDDVAREAIARYMQLFNDCAFKILMLHPVDGGGITDPETWSRRCRKCRRRFGNDRWRGSVHQFNLWAEAFKRTAPPDALFTSPIYPYNASYADFSRFQVPEELWRKNSVDYWQHVHDGTDPMIIPMSWMSHPDYMQIFREKFAGRPVSIYAHSFVPAGYFGSWHRLNGSNYSDDSRDIFYLAHGFYHYERWLNVICSGEYAWNTAAPGSEVFRGLYYDIERDHTEPPEIFDEWVPRACRAFFGTELGNALAPIYQAGVQNHYIMDPGKTLTNANKQRRRPMADVDPEDKEGKSSVTATLPDLQDSAARMAAQVVATARAWEALQAAFPLRDKVDPYRRRLLVHYYRRMPLWHLTARARHAIYTANEREKANDRAGARQALTDGLRHFEEDWRVAERAQKLSRGEKDMTALPPLHKRGDVRPVPAELKRELESRLAGLNTELRPMKSRTADANVRIAIFQGFGAELTKQYFEQFANVEVEILETLALAELTAFDCLFVMQTRSLDRHDYFHGLNRYVREGGRGVLFQHDLCGIARSPFGETTPFPEIVTRASDRVDAQHVRVTQSHPALPGLKVGQTLEHLYYDHVVPDPGSEGVVILEDLEGRPVVVAGVAGAGKVIFDGNVNEPDTINPARNTTRLNGYVNAVLMRGAVEWFTGVPLKKK